MLTARFFKEATVLVGIYTIIILFLAWQEPMTGSLTIFSLSYGLVLMALRLHSATNKRQETRIVTLNLGTGMLAFVGVDYLYLTKNPFVLVAFFVVSGMLFSFVLCQRAMIKGIDTVVLFYLMMLPVAYTEWLLNDTHNGPFISLGFLASSWGMLRLRDFWREKADVARQEFERITAMEEAEERLGATRGE